MIETESESLAALYMTDETGWLESMAELIGRGDFGELDYENLREYLTDMAIRDRREVWSRLIVLIAHHLKWEFQASRRNSSWQLTIAEQRQQLLKILESGVLRNHAENELADAYHAAVERAAIETGLPVSTFPAASKFTAREWVALPVPA